MIKTTKITWDLSKLSIIAIAIFIATTFIATPHANAASTIYNMDRLLNESHPFARPTQLQQRPVVAPAAQPAPTVPEKASQTDEKDLDLDDLGPGSDSEDAEFNDPIEPFNRVMFGFNEALARYFLGPLTRGYNSVVPGPVREAVRNFLSNLNGPVVLANDLLQGEFKRGYDTSMRMVINSTAGLLGFVDVAEKLGYESHGEDFGQTLGVWGIGEGLYLVLPIFGPSNPRDALGKLVVDPFFDPLGYYLDNTDREEIGYALTGARGFTGYATIVDLIDEMRENSLDPYGALRSLYRQRRASEIKNGNLDNMPNIDPGLEKRSLTPRPPIP